MLFWIFVITFVLLLSIFISAKAIYDKHEKVKQCAYDAWDNYTDLHHYDRDHATILRAQYHLEETKFNNWQNSKVGKLIDRITNLDYSGIAICLIICIALFGIVSAAMLTGICIVNISAPIEREGVLATREVLVYELENNVYSDFGDDVVGKKELYNQIRSFNSDIASWKAASNNFWIGIFYPDVTNGIDPIPLS